MSAKSTKKSSQKSRTDLNKLRRKDDKSINYDDSPATNEEFLEDAKVFMPQQIRRFIKRMKIPLNTCG